jgi:glycosyltransferase involved in cell wall biosynthesis
LTKNTCVIIPAYNESRTIGRIVEYLKGRGLSVCVIDDGSTDVTAAIAEASGAVILKHEKNMGKGASLRDGFVYAIKENFDTVLIMDGDGQHETSDIDNFFKKMDDTNADIVIGNRMPDTSSMPVVRKLTNQAMSFLISKFCGCNIPDTQCGFKLIKRNVLEGIDLKSSNYDIESEILIKSAKLGFRIESVPIKTIYRGEVSRINPIVDTIRFFSLIIRSAGR